MAGAGQARPLNVDYKFGHIFISNERITMLKRFARHCASTARHQVMMLLAQQDVHI
jgi:hypothetical protein